MNREIKFQTVLKNPKTQEVIIRGWGFHEYGFDGPPTVSGWEILAQRQYIGLKDKNGKNGKEIYEGDVVSFFGGNLIDEKLTKKIGLVSWDEENLGWAVLVNDEPIPDLRKSYDDEKFEVIGNIYENPELIKP